MSKSSRGRDRQAPAIRTSKNRTTLSRRTFLRGVLGGTAVTLAIPTMESMLGTHGTAYADGTELPRRFGVFFWGNGVAPDVWVPSTTGPSYTLSPSLEAFANVRPYLSVISGMDNPGGANHTYGPALILTGEGPQETGASSFGGGPANKATVDQLVANVISTTTPHRSLQVGVARYAHEGAASEHILDNISFAGPGTPLKADLDPGSIFDRLFGADFKLPEAGGGAPQVSARDKVRAKVLDAVMADASRLRDRVGQADRHRLDQHLEAILAIQKRITTPVAGVSAACKKPALGSYDVQDFGRLGEKTEVVSDLLQMALACDLTRVFAYQWSTPASHASYPEVGINSTFHETVHNDSAPHPSYRAGISFIMSGFAKFLERLKNTPEGAGNLLDSACIMGTSCIATQAAETGHLSFDWPLLVAGRAGGRLKSGIHYRSPSSENAQKVPFTCMKAMGVPITEWGAGDAYVNQPVPGLLV